MAMRARLPLSTDYRLLTTGYWLLPFLLPVIFFAPYLGGHIVPFGDDILLLNYPLLALLAHALRAGYPVLWNPYSGGGYPLAPFSALPFYPPSWLLAVLPVSAAMNWTYVLDLAIGGVGAYALAAWLGVSRPVRLVPAAVFPFSGFVLAHLFAGHYLEVGLICWLPGALAALHWAAEAPALRAALRRGLLSGGPLGMLILANGVSWLVFVAYPVGLVALLLVVRTARAARRGGAGGMLRAAARPLLALAAAGVVAGLLGAVVVLPLRDLIGATVRGGAMSYHAATRISEPALGLAMAIAPGLFGTDAQHSYWFPNPDAYFQEVYAYVGLLPPALAIGGAVVGWRRRNVPLYTVLAALGVVLALGSNTPLYALLYHLVPGLDLARVPARWLLLTVLGVAVLSGVGADALLGAALRRPANRLPTVHSPRRPARRDGGRMQYAPTDGRRPVPPMLLALAALLALGLVGVGLALGLPQAAHHGTTIGPALARLLVVALLSGLCVLVVAQLPRPAGLIVLLALIVADLWSANGTLVRPLDPAPYYTNAAVNLAHGASAVGRVWALDRSIPLRVGMLDHRTYDVQDFAPLTLADYWLLTHPGHTLQGVDTGSARAVMESYNARVATLLGVSLVIARYPLRDRSLVPLARVRVPRWGLLYGDWSHPGAHPGIAYAYRVATPLSFALPVYTTHTLPGHVPLAAIFAPGFDARRIALLDGDPAPAPVSNVLLDLWRRSLQPAVTHRASDTVAAGERSPLRMGASAGAGTVGPGVILEGSTENGALLEATMAQRGVLLLDQVYDAGWTATVDGRPAVLRRADYLLTALPLPAGRHRIALVYAPPAYLAGAALSVLGYVLLLGAALAGVAGLAARGAIRQRRNAGGDQHIADAIDVAQRAGQLYRNDVAQQHQSGRRACQPRIAVVPLIGKVADFCFTLHCAHGHGVDRHVAAVKGDDRCVEYQA